MLNKKQVDFFTSKEKNCKLEHHHYFDEKTKFIYMSILIADSGSTKTDWVLLKIKGINTALLLSLVEPKCLYPALSIIEPRSLGVQFV